MMTPCSSTIPARGKSLRWNFSWTLVGNVFFQACQMGILMLLAKLCSTDTVGQYAIGIAIVTPIIMFSSLQLRNAQVTDARAEYTFGDYLALRLLTTVLSILLILLIAFSGKFDHLTALAILLVGLARAFDNISDVFYGLFQQREHMDLIAKSMIIKGVLLVGVQGLGILLTGSFLLGLVGVAVAWLLLMLLYDVRNGMRILRETPSASQDAHAREIRPRWQWTLLWTLVVLALPLGIMRTLITLTTYSPRYFVTHFLGNASLGIFTAMASLTLAASLITTALGQAAMPRLARYFAAGEARAYGALLLRLVLVGVVLGLAGLLVVWLGGKPLLMFFFTKEYAAYHDAFMVVMLATALTGIGSLLNCGTMSARAFRPLTVLYVLVVVSSLAACALLIRPFGLVGAAWTVAISASVHILGSLVLNARTMYGMTHRPVHAPTEASVLPEVAA